MANSQRTQSFERPITLGIEGGGTRTTALLADSRGREIHRASFGPGNVRLLDDRALVRLFRNIAKQFEKPTAIGLGLAGARNAKDRTRVQTAVEKVWKGTPCHVTHDLEIALADFNSAAVLVLSGTGSCCFGKAADGRTAKMGGWGHILGDKGSGFEIGLRALKACVFYFDRDGTWSRLGERLLRTTGTNEPDELIDWIADADKHAVAELAPEVFAAAKLRDRIARDILEGAAGMLAKDAVNCARKLADQTESVTFVLSGGVLRSQPAFARKIRAAILKRWPKAKVQTQKHDAVWGAISLATLLVEKTEAPARPSKKNRATKGRVKPRSQQRQHNLSPTELRNPRSMNLDRLSMPDAVDLMLTEEQRAAKAVRAEAKMIARLAGWVAKALAEGGRLFYVGAGTSGRLGVLDASECPPTFRAKPEQVQGIIAGGPQALTQPVEGAEDDPAAGARAIQFRGVGKRDVVIGIAASGRTPFVWGAMEMAAQRGARTALVCFNPAMKRRGGVPQLILAPAIGPEVLTGSTRLKAGTATKLILNCITTLAMVHLGKVAGNLMVDVDPKNEKLRERAVRIVMTLTEADAATAEAALQADGWMVKKALKRLGR